MSKTPELSVNAEKIDKLINRINSGDIRIPAFQRGFVWKPSQIIDLLDSIIKNYPIGSVLLWNTSEKLKSTRNIAGYEIPEPGEEYPINFILDGQQRLSSIYAVFSNQTEQQKSTEKYNPNLDIFEIYYDFEKKIFVHKNDLDVPKNQSIYLRNFLDTASFIDNFFSLDSEFHNEAKELHSKFINYDIPVVTIKNRLKEEVGIIFERINNTGTRLSILDLMTAWTWTDDFHLLEKINELLEELEEKKFGDLAQNILLQTISGVIQNDTTTPAVLKLSGEQVRDNWTKFKEGLLRTIDFLNTELNCTIQDFLPFQQQIAPICKFFTLDERPTSEQLKSLKKWFWKTSFSNRYSTGRTTLKMNGDIETIIQIRQNKHNVLENINYSVNEAELIDTKFSKGNSLTRAFLLLMAQFNPIDLVTGTKIDTATALSEYNRKQYHHIFPNAFLKNDKGESQKRIFSLVNFSFLSADSNKKISKHKPSHYFFSIIPQDNFENILGSNLIPKETEIYHNDDYDLFLERRATLIMKTLKEITE